MSHKIVLIIEDDLGIQIALQQSMQMAGYTSHGCCNGEEAIMYFKNVPNPLPNLIVLDLEMPITNGWEFLDWFSQQEALRSIPVIIHSATPPGPLPISPFALVTKPTESIDLIKTIENFFESASLK